MRDFENIPIERPPENARKSPRKITRRQFVKGLCAAGAVAFAGKTACEIAEHITQKDTPKNIDTLTAEEVDQIIQNRIAQIMEDIAEREKIAQKDHQVITQTFAEQLQSDNPHITLNADMRRAIEHKWHDKYAPGGSEYQDSLIAGLERMKPWVNEIRTIFREYGIDEKYIYLAIAESHFTFSAQSHQSAVGPYQITPKTARRYHMYIGNDYDERRDPIKSARLCAHHLRSSFDTFGDWDMALMDYNGGYTNVYREYLVQKEQDPETPVSIVRDDYRVQSGDTLSSIAHKHNTSVHLMLRVNPALRSDAHTIRVGQKLNIPQERFTPTKEGFDAWLEDKINDEIHTVMTGETYTVIKNDTYETIARKAQCTVDQLKAENGIAADVANPLIRIGQKIQFPVLHGEKLSKRLFAVLSMYKENINYPGKFHAIVDVIKEHHLDAHVLDQPASYTYKRLSKNLTKPVTLLDIAHNESIDVHTLQELNPAITSIKTIFPKDIDIRLPHPA